jgi:hypothetical protein
MRLNLDELVDVHDGGGKRNYPVPCDRWMTLLGYAAFVGDAKVVSALLKGGADPTVRGSVRAERVRVCPTRERVLAPRRAAG